MELLYKFKLMDNRIESDNVMCLILNVFTKNIIQVYKCYETI